MTNSNKIITGVVTLANAHIWEPISIDGSPPLYTATLIISPYEKKTLQAIETGIETAMKTGLSYHRGRFRIYVGDHIPFYDRRFDMNDSIYKGYYVLNAGCTHPPKIVDHRVFPITDHSLVRSGCKVRVSLEFTPAVKDKFYCIACKLCSIQLSNSKPAFDGVPEAEFERYKEEFQRVLYDSKGSDIHNNSKKNAVKIV